MSNIRIYADINGHHWLGVEFGGQVYLIRRVCRVGDRGWF